MLIPDQNPIKIKCNRCGEVLDLFLSDFEPEVEYYQHGSECMGTEVLYTYECELYCPKCGQKITVHVSAGEYPSGCVDSEEFLCEGGTFLKEPHMVVPCEYDDYTD